MEIVSGPETKYTSHLETQSSSDNSLLSSQPLRQLLADRLLEVPAGRRLLRADHGIYAFPLFSDTGRTATYTAGESDADQPGYRFPFALVETWRRSIPFHGKSSTPTRFVV